MSLATLLKKLARLVKIDIREYKPSRSDAARLNLMFKHHAIDLVLDVGANVGQYADYLRASGYGGKIVCFEPLPDAHAHLANLARRDPMLVIAPPMALGESDGEVLLNVAANSQSSSILAMLDRHRQVAPGSAYVAAQTVAMHRLDRVGPPFLDGAGGVFLKIDAQGYESRIIEGASGILPGIRGIQVELSLVPLYEGEPLYTEMISRMERLGFTIHDLNPSFADDRTGRVYQVDCIFFRAG